jgi:hypothetical protein
MPRPLLILLLALALARPEGRARADPWQPEPAAVVYGARSAASGFAPRMRVQHAVRPEAAPAITVVRGIRAAGGPSPALGPAPDAGLGEALAVLCRLDDPHADALAFGLAGGLPVPTRF